MASGGKGSLTDLDNMTTSPIFGALTSFMTGNDPTPTGKPKAYLNWILLDDQLNYVSSYPQSGAMVVAAAGTLNTLGYSGIPITKNGFLYIWVSNESQNWDVFFDNLRVVQYSGPELEETHYYPFGLTMAGISSKALKPNYVENKYKYNDGSELANKEFSDGSGLEIYETDFRGYDPQIGRFCQQDPFGEIFEDWSPYTYGFDNPVVFNDPLGLTADSTGSKTVHHKKHPNKPKYKELAPVTIVAYKKDCKTCNPPPRTVNVGPPPSSAPPINYINWPDPSPEQRAEYKKSQDLYYDRLNSGAALVQGGESWQYLNSLSMYQQWTQAEQEYRVMQVVAVAGIFGPAVVGSLADVAVGDMILEGQQQAYVEAERLYNIGSRDLINAIRYGLRGRLSIDQIIRLDKLANENKDLNKAIKTVKEVKAFWDAIQKALK
jgi:RHS repeat-associated protein